MVKQCRGLVAGSVVSGRARTTTGWPSVYRPPPGAIIVREVRGDPFPCNRRPGCPGLPHLPDPSPATVSSPKTTPPSPPDPPGRPTPDPGAPEDPWEPGDRVKPNQ